MIVTITITVHVSYADISFHLHRVLSVGHATNFMDTVSNRHRQVYIFVTLLLFIFSLFLIHHAKSKVIKLVSHFHLIINVIVYLPYESDLSTLSIPISSVYIYSM
jgi:hypothetical protein